MPAHGLLVAACCHMAAHGLLAASWPMPAHGLLVAACCHMAAHGLLAASWPMPAHGGVSLFPLPADQGSWGGGSSSVGSSGVGSSGGGAQTASGGGSSALPSTDACSAPLCWSITRFSNSFCWSERLFTLSDTEPLLSCSVCSSDITAPLGFDHFVHEVLLLPCISGNRSPVDSG